MKYAVAPARGALCLLVLILASGCDSANDLVTSPQNSPPTAQSDAIRPVALAATNEYTGIPYGVSDLWTSSTAVVWGPAPFTSSNNYTDPATVVAQIDAARAMKQKLILNMTGGSHARYKTDGKFDLAKWKAVMKTYDTPAIKAALLAGVADGTVILNLVMDEPNLADWGGVVTKPLLDEMASDVKNLFPTLPVGVVVRWDWRLDEHYQVMDAYLAQYQWNKGSVTTYRDNVLAQAQVDGMAVVFSINILDGGILNWTTRDCPIPLTGGFGTYSPTCRMTADQVRDWGRILGVAGCAMNMWRYDQAFMAKPENQQAFGDVAATLATVPGKPCRRSTAAPGPPTNSPPTAAFTPPRCTAGVACQFHDGSSDPDGPIATWNWDFGNQATSTVPNPITTYATAGNYSIKLTVTDAAGGTDAITKSVTVDPAANTPPIAAFSPRRCTMEVVCKFTDSSSDPDGHIATWSWEFGNGETSTAASPSATYATEGTYSVTLTVTDDAGDTGAVTRSVTVISTPNTPPTAAFVVPECTAGLACQFEDGSSDLDGSITDRSWDFGDGTTSKAANPSTTFAAARTYSVTLTVTDDAGDTDAVTRSLTVSAAPNLPPTAAFSAPSCTAGATCQFTDGSSDPEGSIATWSWEFGNGATSTAKDPSTTYAAPGSYSATLTVTDAAGATDVMTKSVTASAVPNIPPTAAFAAPNCTIGVACLFTDGSSDADGSIADRSWTFGNGTTSTASNPSTTYPAVGTYSVSLSVTDNAGATDALSRSVTVSPAPNVPPTATFIAPSCTAGVACQFTDGSSDADGSIASRSWTFGNGATSTATNPLTTYAAAGSYSVTLKVTDNAGSPGSVTKSITVGPAPNRPPTAAFTVPSCTAGVSCQFTDGSSDPDGSIATRSWALGNGVTSTATNPLATYAAAGSYGVTLKVTDNAGGTGSVTKSVTVAAPLPASNLIKLSLTGSVKDNRQYVMLTWSGLSGATIDQYRDGVLLAKAVNDGSQNTILPLQGKASYAYQVCELGKTRCSAVVTFTLPSILLNVTAWIKEPGLQAMTLLWIGATGATTDVYRNGVRITTVPNTGRYTDTRRFTGPATYVYKACVTATTKCSSTTTATFP
jgi:PKD repeat protein